MEEIKKELYTKVIKKFTLHDIARHKTIRHKNLIETMSIYPRYGVGSKIKRKTWPKDKFIHVTKIELFVNFCITHFSVWSIWARRRSQVQRG